MNIGSLFGIQSQIYKYHDRHRTCSGFNWMWTCYGERFDFIPKKDCLQFLVDPIKIDYSYENPPK